MAYHVNVSKVTYTSPGLPAAPSVSSQTLSPSTRMAMNGSGGLSWPTMDYGMLFRDIGSGGLRQFSGYVREEFLPQLAGRQAARVYREMLDNSSVIGSIMFAITSIMRKVQWRVEAADESPEAEEAREFIESCMDDMSHTWSDFVNESLSMLGYGYAPHEIVYKKRAGRDPGNDPRTGQQFPRSRYDDGLIGWRRIPIRAQDTVIKWFFDQNSSIRGLTQQPWIGPLIDIPIEKLLLFRPLSHKNNPEGRSILRNAYRSYYFAKRLEEQEAILFERLSGLPVLSVPSELLDAAAQGDAGAAQKVEAYKKIVTNVRVDEQMGVILPSDRWPSNTGASPEKMFELELVSPQATRGNVTTDNAITRYNVNMMTSVLADFLQLGHEAHGTQNLATVKTDMFFQGVEGFLNGNADVMNRHAIDRLWHLNGFDPDVMPRLKPDMPQRLDLDVLSNFILRLSQAGMPLFPNADLENYIRDAGGLPDIADDQAYAAANVDGSEDEPAGVDPKAQAQQAKGPLEKMIAASLARRFMRLNGADGTTKKRVRKSVRKSKSKRRKAA